MRTPRPKPETGLRARPCFHHWPLNKSSKKLPGNGQGPTTSEARRPEHVFLSEIWTYPGTYRSGEAAAVRTIRLEPKKGLKDRSCFHHWLHYKSFGVEKSEGGFHVRAGGPSPRVRCRAEHKAVTPGAARGDCLVIASIMNLSMFLISCFVYRFVK